MAFLAPARPASRNHSQAAERIQACPFGTGLYSARPRGRPRAALRLGRAVTIPHAGVALRRNRRAAGRSHSVPRLFKCRSYGCAATRAQTGRRPAAQRRVPPRRARGSLQPSFFSSGRGSPRGSEGIEGSPSLKAKLALVTVRSRLEYATWPTSIRIFLDGIFDAISRYSSIKSMPVNPPAGFIFKITFKKNGVGG
jgi:hypothetical protein